jgi:hypothetical protein
VAVTVRFFPLSASLSVMVVRALSIAVTVPTCVFGPAASHASAGVGAVPGEDES